MAVGTKACAQCGRLAKGPNRSLWALAVVGVAAAVVLGFWLSSVGAPPTPSSAVTGSPPVGPPVQDQPLTPRQEADGLFNQVMAASEAKDAARVAQLVPHAVAAYEALGGLDDDGRFHLALLLLEARRPDRAIEVVRPMLARNPDHLFGLRVLALANVQSGNGQQAKDAYEKIVAAYSAEAVKELPEYVDHRRMLPITLEEAKAALGR